MESETNPDAKNSVLLISQASSELLTNCRPLPEDLIELNDKDTACQFCGVSYLLLSKYDRMVSHVSHLEKELEKLKTYAAEYPVIFEKAESLNAKLEASQSQLSHVEDELKQTSEDATKANRALYELQLRHTRLTHDYEESMRRNDLLDQSRESQLRMLATRMLDVREELLEHSTAIKNLRNEFYTESKQTLSEGLVNITKKLHQEIPRMIQMRTHAMLEAAQAKHSQETAALREELQDSREELQATELRSKTLQSDLASLRESYDEYIETNQKKTHELHTRLTHAENMVTSLRTQIQSADRQHTEALLSKNNQHDLEINLLQTQLGDANSLLVAAKEALRNKDEELKELQSRAKLERERAEEGASAAANRALAGKDVQIMELTNRVQDLNKTIKSLQEERQKMIDAHQSRVGQLQDKYADMLKNASAEQVKLTEEELRKQFEKEKSELLAAQKAVYQKQINDVKGSLLAQLDSARLSKDNAVREIRRKMENMEEELERKLTELREQNKTLQDTLAETAKKSQEETPELARLRAEMSKRESEIKFLKETVRRECEERMELMAAVDALRRGAAQVPDKVAASSKELGVALPRITEGKGDMAKRPVSASGASQNGKNGRNSVSSGNVEGGESGRSSQAGKNPSALMEAGSETMSYQSMLAAAAVKKNIKLRNAAKRNGFVPW